MSRALGLSLSLLAYAVLVLYDLDSAALSTGDESLVQRASKPLQTLFANEPDPLYLLLVNACARGESALWLHLPSILCGLLALVAGARMLRGLAGAHAAPGALLLLAASPFLAAQARALSPATLALLLVALSYALFWEYLRSGKAGFLIGWTVVTALSFGAQVSLIFLPLLQSVIALFYWKRYPQRQALWWGALAVVLAIFAFAFREPATQFLSTQLPPLHAGQLTHLLTTFCLLSTNLHVPEALVGTALFALLVAAGLRACADWRKDARHGLLVAGLLVPCIAYALTQQGTALLLCALPSLCGLAAMGLRLFPQWARQGLWAAGAICYSWSYWNLYP